MATFAEVEEGSLFFSPEGGSECFLRLCATLELPDLSPSYCQGQKNCLRLRDKTLVHFSPEDPVGFIINTEVLLVTAHAIVEARQLRERIDQIQHDSGEIMTPVRHLSPAEF